MTKEEEQKLVRHLYEEQLERFEMSKTERLKKVEEEARKNHVTMSHEEIEDQVKRMYNDEIDKSKKKREELQHRYVPEAEEKKVSKAHLNETVNRLYHVDYEKRDEELFKKYVYPNDPKQVKISQDQLQEMANRLSTKGGS
ncbi:hypothetical protein AGDE_04554 [Angomonas deanei]|nr:hypothetical protein AGDE_04554 [Angomonas deanei]|eukprot:EPY39374.1 hypothetical protein AGDE_04554 [Angomonas deanei]